MKIRFFSLLLAFVFCSCGNAPATSSATEAAFSAAEIAAQTKAYEDMMGLHDKVMPKMSSIAQMQKMLRDKIESPDVKEGARVEFQGVYDQLEGAYDGMMDWMKGIKSMDDLRAMESQEKVMEYVKIEKESMAQIEEMLEADMSKGYTLLGLEPGSLGNKKMDHDHEGHDHSGHDHDHSGHDH